MCEAAHHLVSLPSEETVTAWDWISAPRSLKQGLKTPTTGRNALVKTMNKLESPLSRECTSSRFQSFDGRLRSVQRGHDHVLHLLRMDVHGV